MRQRAFVHLIVLALGFLWIDVLEPHRTAALAAGQLAPAHAQPAGRVVPDHLAVLQQDELTGITIHLGQLKDIGERGFNLERMFNVRFGLTEKDDSLPKRITDVPQVESIPNSKVPLDQMKVQYYKIRGWDANGIPGEAKKRQLSLA